MNDLTALVAENLRTALGEIAEAALTAGRKPQDVKVIAVTKTHPALYITAAVESGIEHIGENRVSEGGRKIRQLGKGTAVFHAIGVLHRSEVRQALRDFHCIDAVDRVEILEEIARRNGRPEILLEVNTSGETSKMGFPPESSVLETALGKALELGLPVKGFLTVGPLGAEEARVREAFALLRNLRDQMEKSMGIPLPELSMGMSDDFALAVGEGATSVRLGRRLFGERRDL